MTNPVVSFKNLSIVFGDKPTAALPLIDAGKNRAEIQEQTGQLVGVANATFDIQQGELLVLMGLSGSGKSTCSAPSTASTRSAVVKCSSLIRTSR